MRVDREIALPVKDQRHQGREPSGAIFLHFLRAMLWPHPGVVESVATLRYPSSCSSARGDPLRIWLLAARIFPYFDFLEIECLDNANEDLDQLGVKGGSGSFS